MKKNFEIKAKCTEPQRIRNILKILNAKFIGTDRQIDTYFNVKDGRLKLREGNIEKQLIFYRRSNEAKPKKSDVILYKSDDYPTLKQILSAALGIKIVVEKQREIYFVKNVKIHIDTVEGLGNFVEIEAQGDSSTPDELLRNQCYDFLKILGISEENLISLSYSDILLNGN